VAGATHAGRQGSGLDITEAGTKKSLAICRDGPGGTDARHRQHRTGSAGSGIHRGGIREHSGTVSRSQIKGVLRNQSNIAGIGNAYSGEILHTADGRHSSRQR
jgi:formamidopyrimidine-DNA glycosylase